jgi:outer membrane protein OmpA-like peptidoglycan-associated protein
MAEPVRDNRFLWGAVIFALLLAASLVWIWGIGNSLSTVDQRARQLEARLADTVSLDAVAALEARQAELEAAIAAVQMPEMGPVQQQVDDLKTQLAELQTQFAGFTLPGLDEFAGRLDAIETSMQGLKTQVGDLAPQRVDDIAARVDALTQQVAAIETQDGSALATQVAALDGRVSNVEANVTDIASALPEGLQGRLDELADRLAQVSVLDIAPVETRLDTAITDIETLKTGVAAAATNEQLGVVETRVAELGAQVSESGNGLASVTSETTSLSTRIGELATTLSTKAGTAEVTSLSGELDALKAQIADLPPDDTSTFATDVATLRSDLDALAVQVAELPAATEIATLRDEFSKIVADPPSARPPQLIERIYFGSSSTSVDEDEVAKIQAVAQRLTTAPAALEIVGFSDSQGPAELNRSLPACRRRRRCRRSQQPGGADL